MGLRVMSKAGKIRSVLIVDDDPALIQTMEEHLRARNLSTTVADKHTEVLAIYEKLKPDAIVVNLDFCQDNGPQILRNLRNRGNVPIILIGNRRGDNNIVVRPQEDHRKTQSGRWLFGGWSLCLKTRQLREPSGAVVALTKGEYALLVAFVEAAQRPLSREYLQRATRIHENIFDRSIDVQILRLRRKLEVNARASKLIRTVRGVGYEFSIPAERA